MVGDLGGVSDLLIKFCSFFVGSFSYFSFTFEAVEDLYLLKFRQADKITVSKKDQKKKLRILKNSKSKDKKLKSPYFTISFTTYDKMKIWLLRMFENLKFCGMKISEKSQ